MRQFATKKDIKAGKCPAEWLDGYWADESTHPEEWLRFGQYNVQDVAAMRSALKLLEQRGPLPARERTIAFVDLRVNERGMPIDLQFVHRSKALTEITDASAFQELVALTGIENPNSPEQVKRWLTAQGFSMKSIAETNVAEALASDDTPSIVRQALELRDRMTGASAKKLAKVLTAVSADGYLRDQFVYHGAHTARWAGRGVQPQNFRKPVHALEKRVPELTEFIRTGQPLPPDVDPAEAIKSTIRSMVRAPEGMMLVAADLAGIECRVGAWISECTAMMRTYHDNLDQYLAFGVNYLKKPYEQITKQERSKLKPLVLGAQFGLGWRTLQANAKKQGTILSDTEAKSQIDGFKSAYPEVPRLWNDLEKAFKAVLKKPGTVALKCLNITGNERGIEMQLPSGRCLFYRNARLKQEDGSDKIAIAFQDSKGWKTTCGSQLFENLCQAIARDVMADSFVAAERAGLSIVLHCHDEIVLMVSVSEANAAEEKLKTIMTTTPSWAPGLPLGVAAGQMKIYGKD